MKREEKKEANKERILEALESLMKDKSLDQISADEISKLANLSKRTLYSYYESKTSMYLALMKKAFEKLNAYIEYFVPINTGLSETLEFVGRAYLNFMLEERLWGKLILEYNESDYINSHPDMIEAINEEDNPYDLNNLVREFNSQSIDVNNSTIIALWSQVLGLAQLILYKKSWLCEYYKMSIEEIIDSQMDIMRNLLKSRSQNK